MGSPYRELAQAINEKKALDAKVKTITKEIERLGELVQEKFLDDEITSVSVNSEGRTLYLDPQIWAKLLAEKNVVAKALEDSGLGDYVTKGFNTNSLSAHFRERVAEEEPDDIEDVIPEKLKGKLGLTKKFKIGSTTFVPKKSGTQKKPSS